MEGRNGHPPTDKALPIHMDSKDLKAAETAARQLPENFSFDAAKRTLKKHIFNRKKARRSARVELRESLQTLFGIYVWIAVNAEEMERLRSACVHAQITLKSGTDVALTTVRYYLRDLQPEAADRYANVLREAALRNVPPNTLAMYFKQKGHGINALSLANQNRRKPLVHRL